MLGVWLCGCVVGGRFAEVVEALQTVCNAATEHSIIFSALTLPPPAAPASGSASGSGAAAAARRVRVQVSVALSDADPWRTVGWNAPFAERWAHFDFDELFI